MEVGEHRLSVRVMTTGYFADLITIRLPDTESAIGKRYAAK